MSQITRRDFLRSGGLAVAALGLGSWPGPAAAAGRTALTRYSVHSGPGRQMLAILADAVTKMRARPEGDPRSWVFQWYTHLVKGPGNSSEAMQNNKTTELQRVFPDPSDPNRAVAEAMWNTCEPHLDATRGDYFLPWHRMYLAYFEQIVRAVTGAEQFTLPYWDYTDPALRSVPVEFRRPGDALWGPLFSEHRWPRINAGKPVDEPPSAGVPTANAMAATNYQDTTVPGFCSAVQSDPHRQIHLSVGDLQGMMSFPYTANDPLFWLHHCNIDRMWASWNAAGGVNPGGSFTEQAYTFVNGAGEVVTPRVGEFLDISAAGYMYDAYLPRPDDSLPFSEAGATTFIPLAASARDAGRLPLGSAPVTVRLLPEGSALPGSASSSGFRARVRSVGPGHRLYLLLEGLSADVDPGTVFEVYLSGGGGVRQVRNDPAFLGAIEFMETGRHHVAGGVPHQRNHGFTVGAALRRLLAEPGAGAPQVTLAPTGPLAAGSVPTIGGIVLGALGGGA